MFFVGLEKLPFYEEVVTKLHRLIQILIHYHTMNND